MKISPVKNYKMPAYALKLAALITAAASVSGCAENGGAAITTGEPATSGTVESQEGTAPAYQAPTTAAPETTISGTVTTVETTTECLNDTELAGEADIPEETAPQITEEITEGITAAVTAAVTSAAVSTAVTSEDCLVEGVMQAPEENYTEPELEGELPEPEEDPESQMKNYYVIHNYCENYIDADVYFPRVYYAEFETNDGTKFEGNIHVEFVNTEEANYEENAFIIFVDKNDEAQMNLYRNIKDARRYPFGYFAKGKLYDHTVNVAIVPIDGMTSTFSEKNAADVVQQMVLAGWIREYEIAELDGGVEVPEDNDPDIDTYVNNNLPVIKKAFEDMTDSKVYHSTIPIAFDAMNGDIIKSKVDVLIEPLGSTFFNEDIALLLVDTYDTKTMNCFGRIKGLKPVSFGFLGEGDCSGEKIKSAIILVDDVTAEMPAVEAEKIVSELIKAGWITEYIEEVELGGDVEAPQEEVDTASHDYAARSLAALNDNLPAELGYRAALTDEEYSDEVWVRGKGYSFKTTLDVALVPYTGVEPTYYLSFIDTNEKNRFDTLRKMGATEYKYGFVMDAEFDDTPIKVIFVEVNGFDGKIGANAAKKLIAELTSEGIIEKYEDVELEGEPAVNEE